MLSARADYHGPMTQAPPDIPMRALFDAQFQASRAQIDVPLAVRRDRLKRMRALINTHGAALADAVQADFGVRSAQLTEVADFLVLRALLGDLEKHLAAWCKPQRVKTPLYLKPASAYIQRQPLGVVGVIGPWNYPLQLTLGPAATALAAGNRVMIKPSELTPHSSALLAKLLHETYEADEVCVVQGGADVAHEFASLPFDHLLFTGSTAVGRKVAAAAAANLTPTTLELGGKSPCVIDPSVNMADAALKIAHGKLLNAGQTCIAPDYVLLPRGMEAAFEQAFTAAVSRLFPTIAGNPDYTAILTERHQARLQSLVAEVESKGARVVTLGQGGQTAGAPLNRQMAPTLVFDAPADSRLMVEEIFGPVLPVLVYDGMDDAVRYINERPAPPGSVLVRIGPPGLRPPAQPHRERRRDGERHADAHRPRKSAVWRGGRKRLGRLPRGGGFPALHAAKAGAGAVALRDQRYLLPTLRGEVRPRDGSAQALALSGHA